MTTTAPEALATDSDAGRDLRHKAYRLAFAVTVGLTVEALRGAVLPPLAAVIALQILSGMPRAPGPKVVVVMLGVMGGTALFAYLVAYLTTGYAALYALGVGLLYLWMFWLAYRPKTAMIGTMGLTMSIVVTALAAASTDAAIAMVIELLLSVMFGFVLVYLGHALFPHRGGVTPAAAPEKSGSGTPRVRIDPAPRALMATAILLPLHLYLTSGGGVAAMLILITTATMLRQPGLAESARYSFAMAAGNLVGAILAAVTVMLLAMQDSRVLMVALLAAFSLVIAGQIVRGGRFAAVYAAGFAAYALLVGLTLSSVPIADGVDVTNRVIQIGTAAVYTLAAASLIAPFAMRFNINRAAA